MIFPLLVLAAVAWLLSRPRPDVRATTDLETLWPAWRRRLCYCLIFPLILVWIFLGIGTRLLPDVVFALVGIVLGVAWFVFGAPPVERHLHNR